MSRHPSLARYKTDTNGKLWAIGGKGHLLYCKPRKGTQRPAFIVSAEWAGLSTQTKAGTIAGVKAAKAKKEAVPRSTYPAASATSDFSSRYHSPTGANISLNRTSRPILLDVELGPHEFWQCRKFAITRQRDDPVH